MTSDNLRINFHILLCYIVPTEKLAVATLFLEYVSLIDESFSIHKAASRSSDIFSARTPALESQIKLLVPILLNVMGTVPAAIHSI